MPARSRLTILATGTIATILSAALLVPVFGASVATARSYSPASLPPKLHVRVTKDKMLRLAPGNNESFCKPDQKRFRLATKTAKGANGAPGKDGQDGVSGWQLVVGAWSGDSEAARTATATCPAGKNVVGGGYEAGDISNAREIVVLSSYPSASDTWTVTAISDATNGDKSFSIRAYAICVVAS